MYPLRYISNVVLIVLILPSAIGCATQGGLSDDGIVNLNHFSLSRPENPLWSYGYSRRGHNFRLSSGEENYSINFKEGNLGSGNEPNTSLGNLIYGFRLGAESNGDENYSILSDEIYSIFLKVSHDPGNEPITSARNLISGFLLSVESKFRGQTGSKGITVSNRFRQIIINNKTFYTADYAIKNGDSCSSEEVYVYLPFEKQNAHFLWVNYKEFTRDKKIVRDCLKFIKTISPERLGIHQEFLNSLGSLKHKL